MTNPTDGATKHFVAMALKRHPWTSTKMLQLAMYSKCLKYRSPGYFREVEIFTNFAISPVFVKIYAHS